VVNSVYKGIHVYGKRSRKQRELIARSVPAIVSEEDWEKAQEVLKSHRILSKRNADNRYLLRGLVRCGFCNLTYTGCTYHSVKEGRKRYYRCNGKTAYRGPYHGKCPGKAVKADSLEEVVWNEIKEILLDPEGVLTKLSERYLNQQTQRASLEADKSVMEKAVNDKQQERERMLDLYRRRLISFADLEKQLAKTAGEEAYFKTRLDRLTTGATDQDKMDNRLHSAEKVLLQLHKVLKEPIPWEVKRQVIELLVWGIKVNTITKGSKREAEASITFAFDKNAPSVNRTPRRAECSYNFREGEWKRGEASLI